MKRRVLLALGTVALVLSITTTADAAKAFVDGNGSCYDFVDGTSTPDYTVPHTTAGPTPSLTTPGSWDFTYTYGQGNLTFVLSVATTSCRGETYRAALSSRDGVTPLGFVLDAAGSPKGAVATPNATGTVVTVTWPGDGTSTTYTVRGTTSAAYNNAVGVPGATVASSASKPVPDATDAEATSKPDACMTAQAWTVDSRGATQDAAPGATPGALCDSDPTGHWY